MYNEIKIGVFKRNCYKIVELNGKIENKKKIFWLILCMDRDKIFII